MRKKTETIVRQILCNVKYFLKYFITCEEYYWKKYPECKFRQQHFCVLVFGVICVYARIHLRLGFLHRIHCVFSIQYFKHKKMHEMCFVKGWCAQKQKINNHWLDLVKKSCKKTSIVFWSLRKNICTRFPDISRKKPVNYYF